jgi:hypothetical protein
MAHAVGVAARAPTRGTNQLELPKAGIEAKRNSFLGSGPTPCRSFTKSNSTHTYAQHRYRMATWPIYRPFHQPHRTSPLQSCRACATVPRIGHSGLPLARTQHPMPAPDESPFASRIGHAPQAEPSQTTLFDRTMKPSCLFVNGRSTTSCGTTRKRKTTAARRCMSYSARP